MSLIVKGQKVILPDFSEPIPATITVDKRNGTISSIDLTYSSTTSDIETIDAGDLLLLPGIVDSHVHINEPGRTDWEGFDTATRAAAAGGVTTVVDMPLNSIPPTTTLQNMKIKQSAAESQIWVDVGFWGGVIPGNAPELRNMITAGICGFKCFLIHSGVDEFPHVEEPDLDKALQQLQGTESVLLFHAEMEPCNSLVSGQNTSNKSDVTKYDTFLQSRPKSMENDAIGLVISLCRKYRVRCHIVHLSSSEALSMISAAKAEGLPLTVETCHHYLYHRSESIPDKATHFKCCPPIRDSENREKLWEAVKNGTIDLVVSDHSPCTADLKLLDNGDFMKAWGGISSLQFGLSIMWTEALKRNFSVKDITRVMCENTAKLAGISHKKGKITVGYDADFVVWDPNANLEIHTDMIHHKNKVTPYVNHTLKGVARKTILRGQVIHETTSCTNSNAFANKKSTGVFVYPKDKASVSKM